MKRSHVFLAACVILLYGAAMAGLYFVEPPRMSREPLMLLIGGLSAAFGGVVQYWFGSSAGSADKTAMLKKP